MTQGTSETPQGGERKAGHAVVHATHGHGEEHGHDHAHSEHPFLQHHFDTPQQQFDAGKLGIWLFLVQEVLFFAGLFCAYTIYRAQHPEIFEYAHYYLDTKLGAVNTIVLLFSSLTAAWAVRCAQLNQQKLLVINIVVTIACAFGFLGIKYVEYSHKVHDGLLWGKNFAPKQALWETEAFREAHPEAAKLAEEIVKASKAGAGVAGEVTQPGPAAEPGGQRSAVAAGEPGMAGQSPATAAPPEQQQQPAAQGPAAGAAQAQGPNNGQNSGPEQAPRRESASQAEQEARVLQIEKQERADRRALPQDAAESPAAGMTPGGRSPSTIPTAKADPSDDEPKGAQTGMARTDASKVTTPGMAEAEQDRAEQSARRSDIAGPGAGAEQPREARTGQEVAAGQDPAGAARQAQASPTPAPKAGGDAAGTAAADAAVTAAMKADELKGVSLEGRDVAKEVQPLVDAGLIGENSRMVTSIAPPKKAHVFFGIYFFMTGLHGLHVIGGIVVWVWLLFRALKGQFGQNYFGPIDFAALYWHLVDLIWIYLFPLLYLID